ncbi:MAG TPA: hypothetical protein VIK13_16635, partial [Candidatus Limnocylindrales bacterium]
MNWRFVADRGTHAALAVLFLIISVRHWYSAWTASWLGLDAQIYYRGSAAWLAGGNPWEALGYFQGHPAHYSALPTTVVLLAPFSLLPEQLFVAGFIAASALAAVYIVRKLELPWYFLAFPPIFQGVQSGNPNVIVLALLLSGRPVLEAFAPLLKVYAGIPLVLLGRRRSVMWTIAFGAVTLLAFPLWVTYLGHFGEYSSRLVIEASGGFSATSLGPVAIVAALVSLLVLWRLDRTSASWLAVPAVWPATQFHYSIFAMPLMRSRPWLAALLAVPYPG